MNPVLALASLDLSREELLHVDSQEHVQVQDISPVFDFGCSPQDRLSQIAQQDLWQEFYALAGTKSDDWLLQIALYLDNNDDCPMQHILELVKISKNIQTKKELFQYTYSKNWNIESLAYQPYLLTEFSKLLEAEPSNPNDELGFNMELIMLEQIVNGLEALEYV